MYYKLSDNIALRSWKFIPRAYYEKDAPFAKGLSKEEFDMLLLCDGEHDITPNAMTDSLEKRRFIVRCEKGDLPSEWSRLKVCDHRHFPKMGWMITGKCNFNCLHCFNAADNAPLMTEWSFEDAVKLLDEARDCGIQSFTITGGEPMVHPRFMDIIREIYKRDMFVDELNTNGWYITQDILDQFAEIGCRPLMKISFDGIGCHDWLRNRRGAEERALNAIRMCVENGFRVMSQTQVNRRNLDTLIPTAELLNSLGVSKIRFIRTTEAPRWAENAPDSCLGIEEYYGVMLDFMSKYKDSSMNMEIEVWQFMTAHPESKSYYLEAIHWPDGNYKHTNPRCRGTRGMVCVTSTGMVVPCMQFSGYYEEHGIKMENVHDTPLREILTGSEYLTDVCTNLYKFRKANTKCDNCEYFRWCTGGCPALGLLFTGDRRGSDISKCLFYQNGWYEKSVRAMEGWRNTTTVKELEEVG